MQQQIAVVTLGIADLARSKHFYTAGFGWTPVFENAEIAFYQMNGLMLATWLKSALDDDMQRGSDGGNAAFALAHNVGAADQVRGVLDALVTAGGTLLRAAEAPPHGGMRGYVADPDGHSWEVAWNPSWPIDDEGRVTFAL